VNLVRKDFIASLDLLSDKQQAGSLTKHLKSVIVFDGPIKQLMNIGIEQVFSMKSMHFVSVVGEGVSTQKFKNEQFYSSRETRNSQYII